MRKFAVPGPEADRDRAADDAAVPGEAGAGEDVAEEVVGDLVPVVDQVVEPRADDAAEQRGEGHLIGPVRRLAELREALGDDDAGSDEAEGEHQPEGLKGDWA